MSTYSWRRWLMAGGVATALASLTAVVTTAKDHAGHEKHEKTTGYYYISDDGDDDGDARSQGYLGVSVQRLRSRLREAMDIPSDVDGLIITNVHDDTPADDAGLRNNDVILRVNKLEVGDEDEFTDMIREFKPEAKVTVSIWRDGATRDVPVTLARRPRTAVYSWGSDAGPHAYSWHGNGDMAAVPRAPRPPRAPRTPMAPRTPIAPITPLSPHSFGMFNPAGGIGRARLGIEIQDLNEEIGSYFGAADGEGVLVWRVHEDGPADKAGLKAGDVIVEIEGHDIDDVSELREEMADHDDGESVAVTWLRQGKSMSAGITLEEGDTPSMYWFSDTPGRGAGPGMSRSLDRGMETMQREMEKLQRQMEELQEKMERLKD
ncbi:MAG TPA: PDZ domain-containing protein [Candidatus Eisenbacteria bacterium]